MNSSKQLESNEIRALAMIVVGRCAEEADVEKTAKAVLEQYLKSIEIFESYNHNIASKKYQSDGIV
ncbi:MAG TPA: hypothetical protein VJ990_04840 [Clostridia bacterium]|nr:hypothetical protein [Clostridia bacterium]